MRKTISACIAFWLTDAPHDGPIRDALTLPTPTPKVWARAALAGSFLSPAASVWTRTVLPPMTVDTTLPEIPAWATAAWALSS